MDCTSKIIQWNCRGLRANFTDLQILFQTFSPVAVSLQETIQADQNTLTLRYYTQYFKNAIKADGSPGGGVAVLVKNCIPHSQVPLTTTLQATAVRLTLHKTITICSIYLPPSTPFTLVELADLVKQLPPPFVLMGDFNAHSPLWGDALLDSRGKLVEDFLNHNNLVVLNSKTTTYMHPATGTRTAIDLTIVDQSLALDFNWNVHDDLCGSDHFPIIITNSKPLPPNTVPKWKLHKADWSTFQEMCSQHLNTNNFKPNHDPVASFTTVLVGIAEKTVPKTKPNLNCVKKPWFNDSCRLALCMRKRALHIFTTSPITQNLTNFKIERAKTRRTIREAKRHSWQTYVSGLNSYTTSKKVWDMVRDRKSVV